TSRATSRTPIASASARSAHAATRPGSRTTSRSARVRLCEQRLGACELLRRDAGLAGAQRERAGQCGAGAGDVTGAELRLADAREVVGEVGVIRAAHLLVDRE